MGFFMALFVSLVMTVVGELLHPKQKPQNAKASGLDDFDIPTAEEGRSIPVMVGKVQISGPNVVAYGDLESVALTKKVKTGMFSSTRQTYAHKYYLGMQMVIAHGADDFNVHEIRFGDAMPKHTRTDEGNGCIRFEFDDEDFFGGNEKEGGITGTLRFYVGNDVQPANVYLGALTESNPPAYRGLAHAVLEKLYLGTSQYIKPVSFIVSRYPNTLEVAGGKHIIGEDANPICFIYEVLTNAVWGVGLQASDIDQVLFRQVAETIHAEGYGVSLVYNGASAAKEVVADVLRHIDGIMFSDPQTGLVSIRLARKDYVLADLPVYGEDEFIDGIQFARPSWLDTKNTVKSTYVDREAEFTTAIVAQQDLANIMQRGGEVAVEDLDFSGFSAYAPAALATARALKTLAYPLARMSGELDRRAWNTRPGDVFRLNWPELGIKDVVFRINTVRYGGLDRNTIGIEAVEDIFSISDIAYVQPPPSGWVNPLRPPEPMLAQDAAEMPFGMDPSEGTVVGTFGYRSNGIDEGYAVVSDREAPYDGFEERARVTIFTPFATLADYYLDSGDNQAPFLVEGLRGAPDSGGMNFARIVSGAGEEWVAYTDISGGVVSGVERGVFDTVPLNHPLGAYVYFASSGYGRENEGDEYTAAGAVRLKLLPYNPRGLLDPADAAEIAVALTQRSARPYPPGKVRVNGARPVSMETTASGTFALSFASRSRLHPALVGQDDDSVPPEPGTTYNVRAYRADTDALLAEGSGNLPSASVTLGYTGFVRIEIESERDGLASHARQRFVLDYTATGAENRVTVDSAQVVIDGGEVVP